MSHNVVRRVVPCVRRSLSTLSTSNRPCQHSPSNHQVSSVRNFCTTERLYVDKKSRAYAIKQQHGKFQIQSERDMIKSEDYLTDYEEERTSINLSQINKDCEALFEDPEYFKIPVLMLHCQYTEFAVSFHAPDKLTELDKIWSMFQQDLGFYGTRNRDSIPAIDAVMQRACNMLRNNSISKCRIVVKGFQPRMLKQAVFYLERHADSTEFVSITDLTRRLGEENPVYQRPVPTYPRKMPIDQRMNDGPKWAPKSQLDKFRRLNVTHHDMGGFDKRAGVTGDRKASKYGFIKKKGDRKPKNPE